MDYTTAMHHLIRIRQRFNDSLTPDQRRWQAEIEDAEAESRDWWSDQFEDEAVRHLPGLGPLVRMFLAHLNEGQRLDVLGKCCRSPEQISDEWDARHGSGAQS